MSNTDKLREIVDKTFPLFGSRLDEWRKVERDKLLSDLTALLEQHKEMMLEFTEWWGKICIEQHGQYNSMEIPKEICGLITMNELFEWWLKNVKK